MITVSNQTGISTKKEVSRINRSYGDIIEYLDSLPEYEYTAASITRGEALDKLFDYPSKKLDTIVIGGSNGKSSAIHFTSKLLKSEGFKVGSLFSKHFLLYNERLAVDSQNISNKSFAAVVNEVINAAQINTIEATSAEILTIAALLYFKAEAVDVVLIEVNRGGRHDIATICNPKIAAVTRVALDYQDLLGEDLDQVSYEMMGIAKKGTWFISAEQSKLRLQKMKAWAKTNGVLWAMPVRKLSVLPYIFEQLYGRSASIGERIAQLYTEGIKEKFSPFLRGNLLATQRGQRGRPTLEAKRQAELNPIKTLKTFWAEEFSLLRGRFEILDREKPTVLLDTARNIDAFENLFLGIRLLHYQHSLKNLALIVGLSKNVKPIDALKAIRYLLKKIGGTLYLVSSEPEKKLHALKNVKNLLTIAKGFNIKAKACSSFSQAFELAKSSIDDRHGLICITGGDAMVQAYWRYREVKKL